MNVVTEIFQAEKHYDHVAKWWADQSWPVIPLTHLPRLGFVVSVDDVMACAGWIYQTDSAFCLFEWIVANPEVRHAPRAEALSTLIDKAKAAAAEMGFQSIFMSVRSQPLISRLHKHGFGADDPGMTNLIFNFQGGK